MNCKTLKISDKLTIREKTRIETINGERSAVYEYFIGRSFIFGALEPFTASDLMRLYLNGYFDPFIREEAENG